MPKKIRCRPGVIRWNASPRRSAAGIAATHSLNSSAGSSTARASIPTSVAAIAGSGTGTATASSATCTRPCFLIISALA
jgi:hypothetical protein